MPRMFTMTVVVPDDIDATDVENWVTGVADELKDDHAEGERWIVVDHQANLKPTPAQVAKFNTEQADEDEDDDDD